MIRMFITAHAVGIALSAGVAATALAQDETLNDPGLVIQPFLNGLSQPTGIRFFAPNQGFVIEKGSGQVKLFTGSSLTPVLDLEVQDDSERGLLGISIDPDFLSNGSSNDIVYLYYSTADQDGDWVDNRLARYHWNGSTLTPLGTPRIFGAAGDGLANGPNHDGGPLAFSPEDKKLYGVTGDLNRQRAEQNTLTGGAQLSSNTGGIYRLNPDETLSTPGDNPFDAPFDEWYAYGVRNSFGLAFDPVTERLWDTENGPDSYDEINLVGKGFNSGWIDIMGPDSRDPQGLANLVNLGDPSYSDPEFSFRDPVGITSIEFLHGSAWGSAYDDAVLVGDNNTGRLYLLRLNAARDGFALAAPLADLVADGDAEEELLAFGRGFGTITDLQVGPDGALYLAALRDGIVYRIAPIPEPSTWLLLAIGFVAITLARRRYLDRATPGESISSQGSY